MIEISVDVRAAEVLLGLRNGSKRMVYAVANAGRTAALAVQKDVRSAVASEFTLRSKGAFILRQAAIIRFPRPAEGLVEASVRVGQKPGLLLSNYEAGFLRESRRGRKVAVPEAARPGKAEDVTPSLFIKSLALRKVRGRGRRRKGTTGPAPIKGLQRTYVTPAGIFQRTGRGVSRLLYAFAKPFRVSPRLRFIETAKRAVARVWRPALEREIDATLRFRR